MLILGIDARKRSLSLGSFLEALTILCREICSLLRFVYFLVEWQAGAVLPLGDVILAKLAYPLNEVISCLSPNSKKKEINNQFFFVIIAVLFSNVNAKRCRP